jgi:hypothetical protein
MNLRFLLLPVFVSLISFSVNGQSFYDQTIYGDAYNDKELAEAIKDLQAYLGKITGRTFRLQALTANKEEGIFLLLNKKGLLPEAFSKELNAGTTEDFVLAGNEKMLKIVAMHPMGLTRGIYTYLDLLGVKWYLPGNDWVHFTAQKTILYKGVKFYSPSFSTRDFFGTGGIRDVPPIDANGFLKKEWEDWKRRNRMGGSVILDGHYGEWFNRQHKTELEQHPEYLAMLNGKRVPWSEPAKWCISNKEFRKLFVADRVADLKGRLAARKYPTEKIILSVEPSDGGGDCECSECKKLGTVSDRDFLLANETAKAFAAISPYAFVNLYAYNTHSEPPSFSLEPNVLVQIIPYAFQTYGTPQQMIAAWKKKSSGLMLYDYFNIPDWFWDVPMPRKTSPDSLIQRIKYWKQQGIRGFLLESVYGTGSAGLGLYLMSRVGWDDKADIAALKVEFFKNMFGDAAGEMKTVIDYLNNKYSGAASLPYLFQLTNTGAKKTGGVNRNRISYWQAYLHYLLLYHQWQSATEKEKPAAQASLLQFIWQIYPLKMVHTTRLADLIFYQWKTGEPLLKDWNFIEPYGKELLKISFASWDQLRKLAADDEKANPVPEDFVYEKRKPLFYSGNSKNKEETEPMLIREFPQTFIRPDASGRFEFSVRLKDEPSIKNFVSDITITCIDTSNGVSVYSKKESVGYDWEKISLKLPAGKAYKLLLEFSPWILFKLDKSQWIGFANIPTYADMHTLWFYVRPGTKYIYFTNAAPNQPVFINGEGKKEEPEKVNDKNMFRLKVKDSDGKWWSVPEAQYRILQFFSKPDLFFLHPNYTISASQN